MQMLHLLFNKQALNATELFRMPGPDGKIMHAEIKMGDSVIMLSDEFPHMKAYGPHHYGGSPLRLMLYTENVDAPLHPSLGSWWKTSAYRRNQFLR